MNQSYIIKHAILSEKTYSLMETGIYTFLVTKNATKSQIAKAVESQFSVQVKKVNIASRPSKTKRIATTRKTTKTSQGKKALVYLKVGQKIEMLSPKAKKAPKDQKVKTSKNESTKQTEREPTKEKKGFLSRIKK